ncbi:MAG TPA: ABC transporter permease subunit [Verrucomicrobiae bacterium]|nr:ABC transporter permease subunit [Verrucomicrobiae bacterium]
MTEAVATPSASPAPAGSGEREHERVGFSLSRVGVIGVNTLTEAVRQKVFIFLLLVGLVFIGSAIFFSQYSLGEQEQLKVIKDTCLGVISVVSTLIAIVGTAQLLPSEVENRTIYTILAKPVRRFEFLLGKFYGSALLLVLSMAAMCLMFGAVLWIKEQSMIRELSQTYLGETHDATEEANKQIQQVKITVLDVNLVKAVLTDLVKAILVVSITLLVSTFSTSLVFNVAVPFMIYVAGMLRGTAVEMWGSHRLAMAVLAIVPDFGLFSLADDINLGNPVPWAHVDQVIVYGLARAAVIVVTAHLIFSRREI